MACPAGQPLVWVRRIFHSVPCGWFWLTGNWQPDTEQWSLWSHGGPNHGHRSVSQQVLEALLSVLLVVYEFLNWGLSLCGSPGYSGICCPDCTYRKESTYCKELLKRSNRESRQDGRRVGGHAHPLPQTQQQQKTHLQDKWLAQNSNQSLAEEPKLQ